MTTVAPPDLSNLTLDEIKAIAANLAHPKGEMGHIVAEKMNENNASVTNLMYDHLNVFENSRVLEIGFGNGKLLDQLLGQVARVDGIDISEDMVRTAAEHQAEAIANGKLTVQVANLNAIPFGDNTFDAVCTANTLYFWKDVPNDLAEIKRVLKPGGRLVLGIRSREKMEQMPFTAYGFTLYSVDEVASLLSSNGFVNADHIRCDEDEPVDNIAIWAQKPW
ncbi:MAG TPA: class I SAM-dependent methyltransferase [Candidatus Kapabacteria bacterium]|nr:class I SAM-dependent methyltransferase [Candidatus Kapabacteria bacterium]